jgi:hypothetical protein
MPVRRATWAAWNYLTTTANASRPLVTLTYYMNILQPFIDTAPQPLPVLVTLNPLQPPAPELTHAVIPYAHPLYTPEAVRSQRRLAFVQNVRGISYAGAWTGYGFHEDGFLSGIKAALAIGGTVPWEVVETRFLRGGRGRQRRGGIKEPLVRAGIGLGQAMITIADVLFRLCRFVLSAVTGLLSSIFGASRITTEKAKLK